MKERTKGLLLLGAFLILYFVPLDGPGALDALASGLALLGEYARLHVLTCLVPALFVAGTIAVFVKKDAVLRLLGPRTKKIIAYPVACISGGILAVCSCTILPLFAGIYKRGAGIGPAVAFLFTGPAVNITAILLTSSVLGWEFAVARLIAAMVISIATGILLARIFSERNAHNPESEFVTGMTPDVAYPNWLIGVFLVSQLLVLVLFGLAVQPMVKAAGIIVLLGAVVVIALSRFSREHNREWMAETWGLSKKILPYLFVGVFLAGMLEAVVPERLVAGLVGGNAIGANLVASLFGTAMYFATLTEVPIVQALLGMGMGKGPALTLFLTGNSLSLPSMIVLFGVMGKKQAAVYILLVVAFSSVAGWVFGAVMPP
jgi:uncharacterized membrane protein YraQ (UPF0718 family)